MIRLLLALLHLLLPYILTATPSEISVADLMSHLEFLESATEPHPHDSRVNFELGLTYQLLADATNTDDAAGVDVIFALGIDSLRSKAEEFYTACLAEDPSNADALSNLAQLISAKNLDDTSITIITELYERAISSSPMHIQSIMNYGIFLRQQLGRYQDAIEVFNLGLLSHPNSILIRFEIAFTRELLGDDSVATSIYEDIVDEHPNYTSALLNLAALSQKHLIHDDAIAMYSRALTTVVSYQRDCFLRLRPSNDIFRHVRSPFSPTEYVSQNGGTCVCPSNDDDITMIFKILMNKGLAFHQLKRYVDAIECFEEVITLLHICDSSNQPSKDLLTVSIDLFLSSKAGFFLSAWDWLESLLYHIDRLDLKEGITPSLMPFDTLGLPVSRGWKRKLATLYSDGTENKHIVRQPDKPKEERPKLRLGFMSHDFSNHPTTFLFEGIAAANHNSSSVEIAAYSYGKDDGSRARQNIVKRLGKPIDGGTFFDIAPLSHEDAKRVICGNWPADIIFDMQGFTLGARPQLMAHRCAGIQVNFLAFPGTSGASYIDYVIVDRFVAAVEHAEDEFTEKLAILPRSYQATFFDKPVPIPVRGSAQWKELRSKEGLSTSTSIFVFANFNKQDKIDPSSFLAIMQSLARVPYSVLWLLEPSGSHESAVIVKQNLRAAAKNAGILPDRLIFAKRVEREDHIHRMSAGDLFLDSFYYGAHTTATDAMRGGMPLLTLAGGSFSSRVGMSLLHGMNSKRAPSLITHSIQEFVDVAVEIATAQTELPMGSPDIKSIGTKLIEPDVGQNGCDLFNWKSYSKDFEVMSKMMMEVKQLSSKNMHIVLAK